MRKLRHQIKGKSYKCNLPELNWFFIGFFGKWGPFQAYLLKNYKAFYSGVEKLVIGIEFKSKKKPVAASGGKLGAQFNRLRVALPGRNKKRIYIYKLGQLPVHSAQWEWQVGQTCKMHGNGSRSERRMRRQHGVHIKMAKGKQNQQTSAAEAHEMCVSVCKF